MQPLRLVIMGVSGCGKTTVGQQLAMRLGLDFLEGDSLHSQHNLTLMAAGTPLSDEDRAVWLDLITQNLSDLSPDKGLVVSCSALKRSYRDRLRLACPALRFVHLQGERSVLAARLQQRKGHYMPASLLGSQLETLEPPGTDEQAITLDIVKPASTLVAHLAKLLARPA
jgi:carbohydrate kinase (thermoresistant glucokinase family)